MPLQAATYLAQAQATTRNVANTDDWVIVITPNTGVQLSIKKISFSYSAGTVTPIVDTSFRLKIQSLTGSLTGGSAFTPIRRHGLDPASTSSVLIKTSTTAFTGGTVSQIFDIIPIWANLIFEWSARDKEDEMMPNIGESFGLMLSSPTTSRTFTINVVWSEF
jgi:hypothetical protein